MNSRIQRHLNYLTIAQHDAIVAQFLDVDIVSEADTETHAEANLKEALELYFTDNNSRVGRMPDRPIRIGELIIDNPSLANWRGGC